LHVLKQIRESNKKTPPKSIKKIIYTFNNIPKLHINKEINLQIPSNMHLFYTIGHRQ